MNFKIAENVQSKFLKRFNISYTNKQVYSQWIRFSEIQSVLKAMQQCVPNEISKMSWVQSMKYCRSIGDWNIINK